METRLVINSDTANFSIHSAFPKNLQSPKLHLGGGTVPLMGHDSPSASDAGATLIRTLLVCSPHNQTVTDGGGAKTSHIRGNSVNYVRLCWTGNQKSPGEFSCIWHNPCFKRFWNRKSVCFDSCLIIFSDYGVPVVPHLVAVLVFVPFIHHLQPFLCSLDLQLLPLRRQKRVNKTTNMFDSWALKCFLSLPSPPELLGRAAHSHWREKTNHQATTNREQLTAPPSGRMMLWLTAWSRSGRWLYRCCNQHLPRDRSPRRPAYPANTETTKFTGMKKKTGRADMLNPPAANRKRQEFSKC